MTHQKALNWLLFALLSLIWGSSFILIKTGAKNLSGWQIGAVRIASASLAFLPFVFAHHKKLPRAKIPTVLLTGILGNLLPAFLFGIAIERTGESSVAGILNALTPLFVVVIGALFFRMNVPRKKITGVLAGFIGLFLLSVAKGPLTLSGIGSLLLILLATVCYGLNVNVVGTYLKGFDPFSMAVVSISFLFIPAGLVLWLHPIPLATPAQRLSVLSVAALGLLGSAAATVIFYTLIKKAGGLFASLVTYVIPLVAIAWGFAAGETIGPVQIGCLGIILGGVYLANK